MPAATVVGGAAAIGLAGVTLHTSDVPHASDAPAAATPALRAIPRVVNISFGEFRRDFLATSTPVIVSGSLDGWPRRGRLSLDRIVEVCGGRSIYPPCAREKVVVHAPKIASKRWGGLWSIPPNERLQNFSDLIAAQQDDGWAGELLEEGAGADRRVDVRGAELYLFDAPIAIFCPALLAELRAPRYFPVDFLRQLGEYGPEADDCVLADECCATCGAQRRAQGVSVRRRQAHPKQTMRVALQWCNSARALACCSSAGDHGPVCRRWPSLSTWSPTARPRAGTSGC